MRSPLEGSTSVILIMLFRFSILVWFVWFVCFLEKVQKETECFSATHTPIYTHPYQENFLPSSQMFQHLKCLVTLAGRDPVGPANLSYKKDGRPGPVLSQAWTSEANAQRAKREITTEEREQRGSPLTVKATAGSCSDRFPDRPRPWSPALRS